jgi:ABC-2 type transport system ATP-binding protein
MHAVETRHLTKMYGKVTAVSDLNLIVPKGSLFGLIGPNGAGKTTTLRMLAGLLPASQGDILINEQSIRQGSYDLKRQIGYMPDFFGVYDDLLVWEYLDFFARCYDIPAQRRKQVVQELIELVELTEKRDSYVHNLSLGMRQRLCLAHALVHDPEVLLLDEPASGMDPRARVEMRELLKELSAMGKTIILSSHILLELAEMCDSIGIIEKGRLVTSGLLENIRSRLQSGRKLQMRVLPGYEQTAQDALKNIAGVQEVNFVPENGGPASIEIDFLGDTASVASLLETLILEKIRVVSFSETATDLEDLFLELTKGEVA